MRPDRVSRRRLATLALLVLASVGSTALVVADIDATWDYTTSFLVFNLFLAWLPFLLALGLYDGYRRGRGPAFLVSIGIAWLLFLPNAPYIVTDFVHLRDPGMSILWLDALMIGAFAVTGLVLGLGSLFLVQAVVTASFGRAAGWALGLGAIVLSSVGIYLGRFLELNSWDAIVDPNRVVQPVVEQLGQSLVHPRFFAVTIAFTMFLVLAYLLVYAVAQPGLALEPRRPTRR
jgi:uncharacterized membrane protein